MNNYNRVIQKMNPFVLKNNKMHKLNRDKKATVRM